MYLRLPVPLAEGVKEEARERGWTINRLVETILETHLSKQKKRS